MNKYIKVEGYDLNAYDEEDIKTFEDIPKINYLINTDEILYLSVDEFEYTDNLRITEYSVFINLTNQVSINILFINKEELDVFLNKLYHNLDIVKIVSDKAYTVTYYINRDKVKAAQTKIDNGINFKIYTLQIYFNSFDYNNDYDCYAELLSIELKDEKMMKKAYNILIEG